MMTKQTSPYRITWILALIGLFALSSCQSVRKNQATDMPTTVGNIGKLVSVPGGAYTDVSPDELKAMLTNKDFIFINVHTPHENDIPATDLFIPYDAIDQNLNRLPADKNAKIVLYCRSGYMSSIAAKQLVSLGYSNVWSLAGGMAAWQQAGMPLENVVK